MEERRYVTYLRVSTDKQGKSGLGLEAQRAAVQAIVRSGDRIVQEYVEVESGKRCDRPVLESAMRACRIHRAVLLIAKLDRLARDAGFLLNLEKSGVEFVCADMPTANRLTVGILAVVAEEERRMISARTKAALAAAKARGTKLGKPENLKNAAGGARSSARIRADRSRAHAQDILPVIQHVREAGAVSAGEIARALNDLGIPARRGGRWQPTQVRRVMARLSDVG